MARMKMMEFLVKHGGDVNAVDEDGCTTLHLAAGKGHLESVKSLLGLGVNVHATENHGRTALQLATCGGHSEVVKVLEDAAKPKACPPSSVQTSSGGPKNDVLPSNGAAASQPQIHQSISFPSPSQSPAPPTQPVVLTPPPAADDVHREDAMDCAQLGSTRACGTNTFPFRVTVDLEITHQKITLQSIVAMPEYQDKSSEELRWEDYCAGFKPSKNSPFSTGYGAPASLFSTGCGAPASPFSTGYGAPASPFSTGCGAPASTICGGFGAPASAFSTGCGAPASPFSTGYGAPTSLFSTGCGAPASLFSTGCGAPASPFNAGYGAPTSLFSSGCGAPASLFSTGCGAPAPAFGNAFGAPAIGTAQPASPQPTFISTPAASSVWAAPLTSIGSTQPSTNSPSDTGFGALSSPQPTFTTAPATSSVWAAPVMSAGSIQPSVFANTTQGPAQPLQLGLFGCSTSISGTKLVPFRVSLEHEFNQPVHRYQSIAVIPEYQHKSCEELRFEDYSAGSETFGKQSLFSSAPTSFAPTSFAPTSVATSGMIGGVPVQLPFSTTATSASTAPAAAVEIGGRQWNQLMSPTQSGFAELATLKQNLSHLQEQVKTLQAAHTTLLNLELQKKLNLLEEQVKKLQAAHAAPTEDPSSFATSTNPNSSNTPNPGTTAAGLKMISTAAIGSSFTAASFTSDTKPALPAFGAVPKFNVPATKAISFGFGGSAPFSSSATTDSDMKQTPLAFGGGVRIDLPAATLLSNHAIGSSSTAASTAKPASCTKLTAFTFGANPRDDVPAIQVDLSGTTKVTETNGCDADPSKSSK